MKIVSTIRAFLRDQTGASAILIAVMAPIVIALVSLGIETGIWFVEKRNLQAAADAGALAGAHELAAGKGQADITNAAFTEAQRNGFGTDQRDFVSNPPTQGGYLGDLNSVEVSLNSNVSLLLYPVLFSEEAQVNARAVAQVGATNNACILSLHPNATDSVNVQGNAIVNLINCVVSTNSAHPEAMTVEGGGEMNADCVSAVGGVMATDGLNIGCGRARTGAPYTEDPFKDRSVPDAPAECVDRNAKVNGNDGDVLLPSGRYCGGLDLMSGNISLEPGTYVIDGGDLTVRATASVRGDGVTFVMADSTGSSPGTVNINGGGSVDLSAPLAGPGEGFLIYDTYRGELNNTQSDRHKINGNSSTNLNGAIYSPDRELEFSGNTNNQDGCTLIVAKMIQITGNTSLNSDCTALGPTPPVVTGQVVLVE